MSLATYQTEPPYYGLNSQALSVIILAQRESLRTNQDFVGTEQLLLGLIREGTGVAAKVLNFSGVTLKDTRIETEKNIGRQGSGFPAVCNSIVITLSSLCFLTPFFRDSPLSPQAKRILELSIEEALQMGHNSIGTEHLLLGLLRDSEASLILEKLGVDLLAIRSLVSLVLRREFIFGETATGDGDVICEHCLFDCKDYHPSGCPRPGNKNPLYRLFPDFKPEIELKGWWWGSQQLSKVVVSMVCTTSFVFLCFLMVFLSFPSIMIMQALLIVQDKVVKPLSRGKRSS